MRRKLGIGGNQIKISDCTILLFDRTLLELLFHPGCEVFITSYINCCFVDSSCGTSIVVVCNYGKYVEKHIVET